MNVASLRAGVAAGSCRQARLGASCLQLFLFAAITKVGEQRFLRHLWCLRDVRRYAKSFRAFHLHCRSLAGRPISACLPYLCCILCLFGVTSDCGAGQRHCMHKHEGARWRLRTLHWRTLRGVLAPLLQDGRRRDCALRAGGWRQLCSRRAGDLRTLRGHLCLLPYFQHIPLTSAAAAAALLCDLPACPRLCHCYPLSLLLSCFLPWRVRL